MQQISSLSLNEDQQRALAARLMMLDQRLIEAETFLSGIYEKGEMLQLEINLTPEQVNNLLTLFGRLRQIIVELREKFALTVQESTATQKLAGIFSVFWSDLEDTRAAKLKGFGEVAPSLAAELDPQINTMMEQVEKIKNILASD